MGDTAITVSNKEAGTARNGRHRRSNRGSALRTRDVMIETTPWVTVAIHICLLPAIGYFGAQWTVVYGRSLVLLYFRLRDQLMRYA
jgi:hypothetical protein